MTLHCIQEQHAGEKWQALFYKAWPFYKNWFLSEGVAARKGYLTSYNMLQHYMPELLQVYEKLTQLAGGTDLEARFLSMYCPPAYMTGCSQMACNHNNSFLIRNYDYSPSAFESNMLYTSWLKPVIGMSDCAWGLLDGMNADGLAASLAFGGRKAVGEGFGIPLLIRYLLETSANVEEALQRVIAVPVNMVYTVTLADVSGKHATIYLSPDREPVVTDLPLSTNHQGNVEWPEYAVASATVERLMALEKIYANGYETEDTVIKKFLLSPLFNDHYEHNVGTLYTILYHMAGKYIKLAWPQGHGLKQSFTNFTEGNFPYKLPVQLPAH